MAATTDTRKFEIYPCGDPFSKAWDATEFIHWKDTTGTFRGDLSGMSKEGLKRQLRRLYPSCEIRTRKY